VLAVDGAEDDSTQITDGKDSRFAEPLAEHDSLAVRQQSNAVVIVSKVGRGSKEDDCPDEEVHRNVGVPEQFV
jgi:hypothetical protein